MMIVVMSQNQQTAKKIWKDKLSQRFSGYSKIKFNPKMPYGLDGYSMLTMVIIYTGGYAPRNKDEAQSIARCLDGGAMLIDLNDDGRKDSFDKDE
ncbi:hypothetical protein [Priestia aryabhattai]|uniref:hypothetical protein n=1 Tax=Priestia aryabhattai TaxID=412384 RepID=UPI003C8804BE